jgi:hypothetical protein
MWKLGTLREGADVEWNYEPSFARQVMGGMERLVIAPGVAPVVLLRGLLELLPEPLWVLYVLLTPLGGGEAGRYQSATPHSRAEVLALLERFEEFLECDGRHNLWLASPPAGQLVLDRHGVIYAYGPVAQIADELRNAGLEECDAIRSPIPHTHISHHALNDEQVAMQAHWPWVISELQETDDL